MLYMMIFVLLFLVNHSLVSPFLVDENNRIGCWEFLGSSRIYENYVILVPPAQYHRGSAWLDQSISDANWSASFDLSIYDGTGGGGFAIWIIKEHGAMGSNHGGPEKYDGVVLLGDIRDNELFFQLIQSNERGVYIDESHINNITIANLKNVSIKLTILESYMDIQFQLKEKQEHIIQKRYINISNYWLGITAQSDEYSSLIVINRVDLFFIQNASIFISTILKKNIGNYQYTPNNHHKLRNPLFISMRTEILQYGKCNGDLSHMNITTFSHVINAIEEIYRVSNGVATYTDLNTFIKNTIDPYTRNWLKRTQKIVGYVSEAKRILDIMCFDVNFMASNFSHYANRSYINTINKVDILSQIFKESIDSIFNEHKETIETFKNQSVLTILVSIMVIEVFCVIMIILISLMLTLNQ